MDGKPSKRYTERLSDKERQTDIQNVRLTNIEPPEESLQILHASVNDPAEKSKLNKFRCMAKNVIYLQLFIL